MDTVLSLQILQSESHPSSHNQGPTKASSGSKEGLSVFGLFQHLAKSPQGRIALKQLFLQPLADLNRINERLDAVSVLARPESNSVVETIRASMSNIKHVKSLLSILGKGAAGGSGQGTVELHRRRPNASRRSFSEPLSLSTSTGLIDALSLSISRSISG